MADIVIIADDYTGANDTAVMVGSCGYKTYTILDMEQFEKDPRDDMECIAYSTDSRGIEPEEAYLRVYDAVKKCGKEKNRLYSKRIDSTLRGNIGAEVDGMLDALNEERMAVIVPAFPQAGRRYIGGCMMVQDVPLYRTAAASDPKMPVHTASAIKILKEQSKYSYCEITLEEMSSGVENLADQIRAYRKNGIRGVVLDAASDTDLSLIAEAVWKSEVPVICVDPGAFTQKMAQRMKRKKQKKCLFVVGSVNEVASKQTKNLLACPETAALFVDAGCILQSDEAYQKELKGIVDRAETLSEQSVLCLCTTGIYPENRIDFSKLEEQRQISVEELSSIVNRFMAEAAKEILIRDKRYCGIFACGGDVAVEVCRAVGAAGEYPLKEVIPLAVYGRLAGGMCDGYHMITKGGMVGTEETMIECKKFLQEKMEA